MKHMKHLAVVSGFLMLIASFTVLAGDSPSGMSLETRVAAQKAIEDVYWKHTVWPPDNPGPKPRIDAVLSDSDIRFKTEEYVRKSYALEWSWYRPITAADLQAEIDRMAEETRDPAVLRKLWAALGNDPLLVAECLARPALVDRLTQQLDGFDARWDSEREDTALGIDTPSAGYRLPEISGAGTFDPFAPELAGSWSATTTVGAPAGGHYHTAVWAGRQMIVWGGADDGGYLKTGGRYTP